MSTHQADPQKFFRLKPIRVARVSEISETTAAAPVSKDERVNFHIGNPVQDSRLSSAFLRIALGINIQKEGLSDDDPDAILEYLNWEPAEKPKLEFLIRTIRNSSPYSPRGGYSRKSPHALIDTFSAWLEEQQEPLHYDTGKQSGKREIILATGGLHETLRVILFALSGYLEFAPARILCYHIELLSVLKESIPNLIFEDLALDEKIAKEQIEAILLQQPETPTFLLMGDQLEEETRRRLRRLSIEKPLFFIEANNAPNHASLAREAKLVQCVIRLLSPGIFSPRLQNLPTVFVAGNADFLSVIENVHFNLKGTPSASEIEFLHFLLEQELAEVSAEVSSNIPQEKPSFEGLALGVTAETAITDLGKRVEKYLEEVVDVRAQKMVQSLEHFEEKTEVLSQKIQKTWKNNLFDEFAGFETPEIFEQLVQNIDQPAWQQALQRSFLSAIVKHQPQYKLEDCLVASGSSRTALGILGFHCGISEVVIPDLSWSYEQCFRKTHTVPLSESLELDTDAIIAKLETLCWEDPTWPNRGAVALNNPHNATGQIFDEGAIRKLVTYCLQRNIYMIDDLAYQNVVPIDGLPEIKTLRQITSELVRFGTLNEAQANRLITVHSMSKTDCFAGARLAILEIRDRQIFKRFETVNAHIQSNIAAIFLGYLFYRNTDQATRTYWHLRNRIFYERTQALLTAVEHLPADRNPFHLEIIPPTGSMYPLLHIKDLPAGLSLDWLASSLARQGIGMLPLATFARTEKGFETGRTTFRLTLGGVDGAETLLAKTRRLLIDLNRLIAEENARYNRKILFSASQIHTNPRAFQLSQVWDSICQQITEYCQKHRSSQRLIERFPIDSERLQSEFFQRYLPERLDVFHNRLQDKAQISYVLMRKARSDNGAWLSTRLEQEFMKDNLEHRQTLFKLRPYDRTVHPTQVYALQVELALDDIINQLIAQQTVTASMIEKAAQELLKEFLGLNVAITSRHEADEILLDLSALIAAEDYAELNPGTTLKPFLSFWSDWDGSNRPSGQGHRLVAAVVMENARRMAEILNLLRAVDPSVPVSPQIVGELDALPYQNQRFTKLLNEITLLTHQLEQRYRGILPFSVESSALGRMATRLHLRRDPARVLWQHNDRYERKMLDLRNQRSTMLEFYFGLNKKIRKQLYALIPSIQQNRASDDLLREVLAYRDILQRMIITPRINQGLILARDPFAIDTTVHNIYEINSIAGKYGNPGITMGLQISLSTQPEALISLDRKMRVQEEQTLRDQPSAELPSIWLIPLFEELTAVQGIPTYLERVWDYATQSRQTRQSPQQRFVEIISEVFIAGSDLSQQVGQANSAFLYRQAKYNIQTWLADHGVAEDIRIKLGSGEPMQRQGGYYSEVAGQAAFGNSQANKRRFAQNLPAAARQSTAYAVTPLQGIFLADDLRTFQSNISEQLRFLPVQDLANLLYHVNKTQMNHRDDLIRAAETIAESRLGAQSRSLQELERLTIGTKEAHYKNFLTEITNSFRQILYGRAEDVVGIHIISYFIGRSIPQLRDRPTSRRTPGSGAERGQRILANIAEIIPLTKQGSMLRAISHNQAQTAILGVNQLTTGLFRALERYSQKNFAEAERERMIAERLLPYLPVYEILNTLRIYQDCQGKFIKYIETAFPAGNSAFVALREDSDALQRYLPLFQQELLRRHGVDVNDFFVQGTFIQELLPTIRPDLAVLLQPDPFNTDMDQLLGQISGRVDDQWLAEIGQLLQLPEQVHHWRATIWDTFSESIYQWVQSFTELATALYAFSTTRSFEASLAPARGAKLSPALADFFRTARVDDEMRNFLIGAIEYLSSFAEGNIEVPVSIIRAMNDVERIAQIEENVLPPEKQDVIRCGAIQIARLAGENG